MPIRRCLVIHFTSGATAKSSIEFWKSPEARGASAHIVIDRDGKIFQCRPFNRTCGHAGKSRWVDPNTGKLYSGLNSCSIGIELANAGSSDGALSWVKRNGLATKKSAHRNGGPSVEWEEFPQPLLDSCLSLALALVHRYKLDDITGHDCIAPERKDDPGPLFPMQWLRESCGFSGLPVVHR